MVAVERDALSQKHTATIQLAFDEICEAAHVYQGWGPLTAYFQMAGDPPLNYVYTSFGMGGKKPEDGAMAMADTAAEVLSASITVFRQWLKPNQTLLWREKPSLEQIPDGQKWGSYWRCVQLDNDAREIVIRWKF
jgi:hypothetical protein